MDESELRSRVADFATARALPRLIDELPGIPAELVERLALAADPRTSRSSTLNALAAVHRRGATSGTTCGRPGDPRADGPRHGDQPGAGRVHRPAPGGARRSRLSVKRSVGRVRRGWSRRTTSTRCGWPTGARSLAIAGARPRRSDLLRRVVGELADLAMATLGAALRIAPTPLTPKADRAGWPSSRWARRVGASSTTAATSTSSSSTNQSTVTTSR